MFKLERNYDEYTECYNYSIINGTQRLDWLYMGNGDLYWVLINTDIENKNNTMVISLKENEKLYYLMAELYDTIIKSDDNSYMLEDEESYEDCEERNKGRVMGNYHLYDNYGLVNEEKNVIRYISDGIEGKVDEVKIYKEEDSYRLEFIKNEKLSLNPAIRFCTSGCRYNSFHMPFCNTYNKMEEVYQNYDQMTIEECIEREKVKKLEVNKK